MRTHGTALTATLVTWDPSIGSRHRQTLEAAGIPLISLGPFSVPRALRPAIAAAKLTRIIRRVSPDVVYPWLEETALLVAPIARAYGLPVVIARRNISGARIERMGIASMAIRTAERLGHVVTGNSAPVLAAARERGVRPERLRLVPNGHVPNSPLPAPPERPVVIGYVARFRPEKGHARLVAALRELHSEVPWRVDLAGDGPLLRATRDAVERSGLTARVRFIGEVRDIRQYWAERAIAALLSDHEGSPNALIEAAWAGRPLVGTSVGGIPDVIEPGGGLVVPTEDPGATARALQTLIEDREKRHALGAGAYAQARQRYGVDNFVTGHLNALEDAMRDHRR